MLKSRDRGMLSHKDRELLAMTEVERQEKFTLPNLTGTRWPNIESRVLNGVEDLSELYRNLPDERRQTVFDKLARMYQPWQLKRFITEGNGFLLLGVLEQLNTDLDDDQFYSEVFAESIRRALEKVSMGAEEVTVDVEIRGWKPHDALHKRPDRPLESTPPGLLRAMLNTGEITDEEFAEAILAKRD